MNDDLSKDISKAAEEFYKAVFGPGEVKAQVLCPQDHPLLTGHPDKFSNLDIFALMGMLLCAKSGSPKKIARDAYDIAEAMVKEREKRKGDK